MSLKIIPACAFPAEVGALFAEYTAYMAGHEPLIRQYLTMQHYDEEIKDLKAKYGQPDGRLYLAYSDGELAGCAGLRKMDAINSEMKRVFVRPAFRRRHIGEKLVVKLIDDARQIGYRHILLDTLAFMTGAIALYRKMGFHAIGRYNDTPIENTVFLQLDL